MDDENKKINLNGLFEYLITIRFHSNFVIFRILREQIPLCVYKHTNQKYLFFHKKDLSFVKLLRSFDEKMDLPFFHFYDNGKY